MRIVGLVESPDHVCARYRLTAFQPALTAAGHTLELVGLPRSLLARVRLFRSLRRADLVILQRKLLPLAEVAILRRSVPRLAFDYDDAIWLRDSYSAKGFESARRARRFRAIIRRCDLVTAGNATLAQEAERFAKPGRVTIIPTCVAPVNYPVSEHRGDPVRLVRVGSSSTLKGLERFRETLERIGEAVPNLTLRLICDRFLTLQNLRVENVPWSAERETADIANGDIGFGWVPDDPWSRGKCGLKILQYQAAGLPVVANPVGVQAEFVRDDITGFQAETTEQWVNAIRRLAENPTLRRELGTNGRAAVEARYSVRAGGEMWETAIQQLRA